MINLYYALPGSLGIRDLYERADSRARRIFDDSDKGLQAYYSFFCRVLTDVGIAEYGADPELITVSDNGHGKEYVKDRSIFYNVSHTRTLLCSAVSDSDVGIDCEAVRDIDYDRLSKRFFTENEQRMIADSEYPLDVFFSIWTKKESYIKYKGTGFGTSLSSFDVSELRDIQATYKLADTYITVTGDITHIKFTKEG